MRTRSRLLLGFVGVHLVLSLVIGWTAWLLLDRALREQAEDRARAVGTVLTRGGFALTPEVVERMQALTGYAFRVLDAAEPARPGTVQVAEAGRVIEIGYVGDEYRGARRAVVFATAGLMVLGIVGFGLVAGWLAGQFARPIEALAGAARRIGAGDLAHPVPTVGSGELRELAGELEHMRVRLDDLDRQHRQAERLATLGTFTATIAHEVRNPLSAVRLTVQLLARRYPADDGLRLVLDEIERLDLIVDELLAFSKGMSVVPQAMALRPVAEDVLRLLRRQAEHAGVTLAIDGSADVHADPARLRQLLVNLVLNAIQAQHGGGAVTIVLRGDGLEVVDRGPGVDPAVVAHLFEPFASNRPGGTGLGLHLAWTIARAHGATLRYEKRAEGCAFVLAGLAGC